MNKLSYQQGVGLIEVLVAVLLLSISVLGFSSLQLRAISATDESLVRTKSMTIVRNLAETMRAYPEAYVEDGTAPPFKSILAVDIVKLKPIALQNKVQPTIQAVISSAATETVTIDGKAISTLATANNCLSTQVKTDNGKKLPIQSCNVNQLAARDALMIKKMATEESIKVNIITCPNSSTQLVQKQMCIITAWNDTKAILNNTDTKACAKANGIYNAGSSCLISEAY